MTNNKLQCPFCFGTGKTPDEVVDYVSKDMAIDAGDKNLEGIEYRRYVSFINETCDYCGGLGFYDITEKQLATLVRNLVGGKGYLSDYSKEYGWDDSFDYVSLRSLIYHLYHVDKCPNCGTWCSKIAYNSELEGTYCVFCEGDLEG